MGENAYNTVKSVGEGVYNVAADAASQALSNPVKTAELANPGRILEAGVEAAGGAISGFISGATNVAVDAVTGQDVDLSEPFREALDGGAAPMLDAIDPYNLVHQPGDDEDLVQVEVDQAAAQQAAEEYATQLVEELVTDDTLVAMYDEIRAAAASDGDPSLSSDEIEQLATDPTTATGAVLYQAWTTARDSTREAIRGALDVMSASDETDVVEHFITAMWRVASELSRSPGAAQAKDNIAPSLAKIVDINLSEDAIKRAVVSYLTATGSVDVAPVGLLVSLAVADLETYERAAFLGAMAAASLGVTASHSITELIASAMLDDLGYIRVVTLNDREYFATRVGRFTLYVSVQPQPGLDAVAVWTTTAIDKALKVETAGKGTVLSYLGKFLQADTTTRSGKRQANKLVRELLGPAKALTYGALTGTIDQIAADSSLLKLDELAGVLGREATDAILNRMKQQASRIADVADRPGQTVPPEPVVDSQTGGAPRASPEGGEERTTADRPSVPVRVVERHPHAWRATPAAPADRGMINEVR